MLPSRLRTYGSTRELLHNVSKLAKQFAALPEQLASMVGRFVLGTWIIEAFPVAPALIVNGPDAMRGAQLMSLLHCFCRHGLRMTGVTSSGFCSLPTGFGFTLLVSQSTVSRALQRLLGDASCRDEKNPPRRSVPGPFRCADQPKHERCERHEHRLIEGSGQQFRLPRVIGYSRRATPFLRPAKQRDHYDRGHDRGARVAGDASAGANFHQVGVDPGPVRLERAVGMFSKSTAPCTTTDIPRRD